MAHGGGGHRGGHGGARITGLKEMQEALQKLARRFPDHVAKALYRRAEEIMTRSKREFVPVDTGNLRATGHVHEPERHGRKISVAMSYGGPAAPYAIAVHEHLSEHSPWSWQRAENYGEGVHFHPAGRGPKYLERPLMEAMKTMAEDIAKDVNLEKAAKG